MNAAQRAREAGRPIHHSEVRPGELVLRNELVADAASAVWREVVRKALSYWPSEHAPEPGQPPVEGCTPCRMYQELCADAELGPEA